jgi:hypothetical protein
LATSEFTQPPYHQNPHRSGLPTDSCAEPFYLDPPYWGRKWYRFNLSEQDFQVLKQRLSGIRGKFVLSINAHPDARQLFREFHIQSIETSYTAQKRAGNRYRELLITNFLAQPADPQRDRSHTAAKR